MELWVVGHLRDANIHGQLAKHYWWLQMRADITSWCQGCLTSATRHVGQAVRLYISDTNSCGRTIPHGYIAIICLCSWQQVHDSLHGLLALLLSWDPTIDSREEPEPPVESTPQQTEWTSRLQLRMRTS